LPSANCAACRHEASTCLLECMCTLARQHPRTQFLKMISTDCIPGLPDSKLPTVLVYHEKSCKKTFAGLAVWGGKRATAECTSAIATVRVSCFVVLFCSILLSVIMAVTSCALHVELCPVCHVISLPSECDNSFIVAVVMQMRR
jgi:hypothetical protein